MTLLDQGDWDASNLGQQVVIRALAQGATLLSPDLAINYFVTGVPSLPEASCGEAKSGPDTPGASSSFRAKQSAS